MYVDHTFHRGVVLDSLRDTREPSVRVRDTVRILYAFSAVGCSSASYVVSVLYVWGQRNLKTSVLPVGQPETQDVERLVELATICVALLFHGRLLTIVGTVEDTRNGNRSVAGDRRFSFVAEVDVLLQCVEDLVPMRSVAA